MDNKINSNSDFTKESPTTVEEWTSVLDVATRFQFDGIKTLAITQLAIIASSIDKIVIGRKYNINKWLTDAYRSVCERRELLAQEDAERLGMEDVVKIANVWRSGEVVELKEDVVERTFRLGKFVGLKDEEIPPAKDRELEVVSKDLEEKPAALPPPRPPMTKAQMKMVNRKVEHLEVQLRAGTEGIQKYGLGCGVNCAIRCHKGPKCACVCHATKGQDVGFGIFD